MLKDYSPKLLLLGVVTLALPGCGKRAAEGGKPADKTRDVILVTREDLFRGDARRIEPHLHFAVTACAKVDYRGRKRIPILLELEVWHNGKRVKVPGPLRLVLTGPIEYSFTLKEIEHCPKGNPGCPAGKGCYLATIGESGAGGNGGYSFYIAKPELKRDTVGMDSPPWQANKPMELAKSKPLVLWEMHTLGKVGLPHLEPEETAKRAEWGALLKLSIRPWSKLEKDLGEDRKK